MTGRGLLRWQASSMALSASFGMSASVTPSAPQAVRAARGALRSARRASPQRLRRGVEDGAHAVEPVVGHRLVELDDRGQAQRVGEAVVQALLARQRVRERVARAEALLERDGAHHRGLHHAAARLEVVAVLDGAREVLRAELEAAEGDGVGHRVVAERAVRLEAVRERVEAGRRGDARAASSA